MTGPKGFYLNADRVKKSKIMHLPKNDDSETRTETKHLIQRLSGNLHPNGQLSDNAKSTLKQWVEEDTKIDHDDPINNKRTRQTKKHRNLVSHPLYSNTKRLLNDPSQIVHAMNTQKQHFGAGGGESDNNIIPRNDWAENAFINEINSFYINSRPNLDRIQSKKRFFDQMSGYIEEFRKSYYPLDHWSVFKFGSAFWGIDCSQSDLDVAIKVNCKKQESMQKHIKQEILQRLTCYVKERSFPFKDRIGVTTILHARCPIITIHNKQLGIKMDVSIADDDSVQKTKTEIFEQIEKYKKKGFPIRKFLVFVKYWTKKRCINDSPHRFVNSFGYTLMVIKYIQYLAVNRKDFGGNLSCLVFGFFSFYAQRFNAKKHVIDIMDEQYKKENDFGCFRRKKGKKVLVVIDPADRNKNVTNNVRMKQWTQIRLEFQRATDLYTTFMQNGQINLQGSLFKMLMKECGDDDDEDESEEEEDGYEDEYKVNSSSSSSSSSSN